MSSNYSITTQQTLLQLHTDSCVIYFFTQIIIKLFLQNIAHNISRALAKLDVNNTESSLFLESLRVYLNISIVPPEINSESNFTQILLNLGN